MKLFAWIFLILALACSGNQGNESEMKVSPPPPPAASVYMDDEAMVQDLEIQTDQKIIRESYLRFQCSDLESTYQDILNYVKARQGYLLEDNSTKGYAEISRRLIIKIPSGNFQQFIDDISKDVSFFDTKTISATDVTEEFIDTEARMKAKKALEERYLQLLSKATNVKDILEIEKELSAVREEIEAKEGRLKYLQNRVAYSTITIEFYKQVSNDRVTVSYGHKMLKALKDGFNGLSYFFLGMLNIWPFILIIALLIFFIRRKYFKKK